MAYDLHETILSRKLRNIFGFSSCDGIIALINSIGRIVNILPEYRDVDEKWELTENKVSIFSLG